MGDRGPMPKPSSELRRRNKDSQATRLQVEGAVRVPPVPKGAHPIAAAWYRSLRESGQVALFEPSDWVAARLLVEQLTRLLAPRDVVATNTGEVMATIVGPIDGREFKAVWDAMQDLFTTAASRRRARVEIERLLGGAGEELPEGVAQIDDFRRRMEQQEAQ